MLPAADQRCWRTRRSATYAPFWNPTRDGGTSGSRRGGRGRGGTGCVVAGQGGVAQQRGAGVPEPVEGGPGRDARSGPDEGPPGPLPPVRRVEHVPGGGGEQQPGRAGRAGALVGAQR